MPACLPPQDIYRHTAAAVVMIKVFDEKDEPLSLGTGFYMKSDGTVVTSKHVYDGAASVWVQNSLGQSFRYTGWKDKGKESVGILQPAQTVPAVSALSAASAPNKQGDSVYTVGFPLGLNNPPVFHIGYSSGEISQEHVMLMDLNAVPGMSGSPIVNCEGDVVGVLLGHIQYGNHLALANPISEVLELWQENH